MSDSLDQHTLNNPADTPSDRVDSDDSIDDCQLHYDTNLKEDLARAFRAIAIPGTFAAWQELPTIPPTGLHVDGIGKIEMPSTKHRGGSFEPHSKNVKTGKNPDVLGTLIICLPSAHTGGEVIVDHNGERKRLNTSNTRQSFACWYSDVTHEVLRIKSGYRCVLTYNLAIQPGPTWSAASANDLQKHLLRKTLKTWLRDTTCSNTQSHLYSALQYQYPETAISLNVLEAEDFVRVQAIRDVTVELPFVIFLALLEKREHGSLDQDGDYDSDSDYQDDCGTHVIDQVLLTRYAVKSLHALDGTTIAKDFDIDMDMCLEEDPFLNTRVARNITNLIRAIGVLLPPIGIDEPLWSSFRMEV
ncbi:hypothetical protein KEM48_005760 [Puccinia striiformis f. sp. tritici PST-130]|nr:hypothetical protein KEM48_005760 [Puccinia striiformis f. sp. tritici PST-130]